MDLFLWYTYLVIFYYVCCCWLDRHIYDNYLGFVVSTEQTRVVVKDNTILSYVARLAYHLTIIKGTEL